MFMATITLREAFIIIVIRRQLFRRRIRISLPNTRFFANLQTKNDTLGPVSFKAKTWVRNTN